MKVFTVNPVSWGDKVNFVDKNNVVVGFDFSQSCCENFGYLLTESVPKSQNAPEVTADSLEPYVFDIGFRKTGDADGEYGGRITFRLIAPGLPNRYLTLFNYHNGYYSHGFDVTDNGKVVETGYL